MFSWDANAFLTSNGNLLVLRFFIGSLARAAPLLLVLFDWYKIIIRGHELRREGLGLLEDLLLHAAFRGSPSEHYGSLTKVKH